MNILYEIAGIILSYGLLESIFIVQLPDKNTDDICSLLTILKYKKFLSLLKGLVRSSSVELSLIRLNIIRVLLVEHPFL